MKRVAAVVFLAVLITAAVQADTVIFDNFGPGDTYSLSGWLVIGPGTGSVQSVAMPFTPSGSHIFGSASVAVGYLSDGTSSFDLALYDDASGVPGTALETWTGISAGEAGTPGGIETVLSVTNPLLTSGSQYWLVASPGADTDDAWMWNAGGTTGPWAFALGGPWISYNDTLSAFRVTGDPASPAVPEPCTCALFAIGALGLLGKRRKK